MKRIKLEWNFTLFKERRVSKYHRGEKGVVISVDEANDTNILVRKTSTSAHKHGNVGNAIK